MFLIKGKSKISTQNHVVSSDHDADADALVLMLGTLYVRC